jgi:hypothetical protein
MNTKSGMLGILPMLAGDKQVKNFAKSGMLGALPSMIAKDMAEEDELKAMQALKANQGMKKGGKVSSASSRADGCAVKGKTKGRFV